MGLLFSPSSFSILCFSSKHFPPRNLTNHQVALINKTTLPPTRCLGGVQLSNGTTLERPLPNFQPTSWSYEFVKSLDSCYSEKIYQERVKKLEDGVRIGLEDWSGTPLAMLELIDDMERLGLGYRFKNEIERALEKIAYLQDAGAIAGVDNNLYATSLRFRLLRQHGFEVSEDVFQIFMDDLTSHQNDSKGLLSLYEASFLGFEKENLLLEAKSFATLHLENQIAGHHEDSSLIEHINHVLELPTYHRAQKLEARWYVEAYSKKENADQPLVELAILDFNMVQSTFQKDLQDVSKWWKNIGLVGNLDFIRDRLVECFFWSIGVVPEPHDSKARIGLTKVYALITAIDDVYDEYGTLEELELFTSVVERWDLAAAKDLPRNLKVCFLALHNTINEMVYDTLKEQGEDISRTLTSAWANLCQTFLKEARWNKENCKPNFPDYIENAWRSVSGSLMLVHVYFLTSQEIKSDALACLENYHDLFKWSSMIFRLGNDLATGKAELERGQTVNAISCYMLEKGVSEELSREYIKSLIEEAWRKMNEKSQASNSPFKKDFIQTIINLARIAECTYHHGDGHGDPDTRAKKRVSSVIIEPIALMETKKKIVPSFHINSSH